MIIYYPCFGQVPSYSGSSMDDYLRDSVAHRKDVEGLCHTYRKALYTNVRFLDEKRLCKCILPCTALSVVKILEHAGAYADEWAVGRRLEGKVVTVINRSEIVGRPLAAMLANDGADVFSVDIDSIYRFRDGRMIVCDETAEACVRKSDIVVCGVPVKSYKLPTAWVKENSYVVNVSHFSNVHEEELLKVPGVKFVGMVGKVTVAMLERNLCRLHSQYHRDSLNNSNSANQQLANVHLKQTLVLSAIAAVAATTSLAILAAAKLSKSAK